MNFWETLILFFSFQATLLSLLFAIRRAGDKIANGILTAFLLLFGFNLFYNVLYWSQFNIRLLAILKFTYYLTISLYGPIFYLYLRRLGTSQRFAWRDLIHSIPLLLVLLQFGPFYILPLEVKLAAVKADTYAELVNPNVWIHPLLVIVMLGYGIYSHLKFSKYYRDDPDLLIWFKAISTTFILFALSHVIYALLFLFSVISIEFDYFITIFMIMFIGLVTYFAFMYASVFNGKAINAVIPFIKYEKTGLSKDFSLEMKEKLTTLMLTEKPFLNPDIRLDGLAQLLDVSRHHASQIINEHFSTNFFDFINRHRIQEAIKLLSSDLDLSITDIAFQCGFNNRISFYKAFKKIVGITPSEFKSHNLAS